MKLHLAIFALLTGCILLPVSFIHASHGYLHTVGGIGGDVPIEDEVPPAVRSCGSLCDVGTHTEFGETYEAYFNPDTSNFVAVQRSNPFSLGFGDDDNNQPEKVDPRSYERWRVIGDVNIYGRGYDYKNVPCTGAPGEDKSRCNNSCQVLDFWSCDTRDHRSGNRVDILVNGVVYDSIKPNVSNPNLLNPSWANSSTYDYTPGCGDAPGNMYKYTYPTPIAWKDGQRRVIQLRASVANTEINEYLYRSNSRRSSYSKLTSSELALYNLTNTSQVEYYYMYTSSNAPTTAILPNAGWDEANKDGDSNDITSFEITCPVLSGTAMDLTGQLLNVTDRTVNVAYGMNGTVRNVGDAGSGGTIPVRLQFDFNRNGFTNGSNGDFQVDTTVATLAAGASTNAAFSGVTHTQTGMWQVRMIVDPNSTRETNSAYRANNTTGWQPFVVNYAAGTPVLILDATSPVTVGEDITLIWRSQNVRDGSCVASGGWTGPKDEAGITTLPATTAGRLTFTLNCTGTDNRPITDTATVEVLATQPDLTFARISYDTCSPAEQNQTNGDCPNTTVSFVIKNQGVAIPSTVTIPYRLEREVNGAWTSISGATGNLAGLGAGQESSRITINVPNLPDGVRHRFRAQVNQPNTNTAIGETRFSNNATTTPYFTLPPVPPDYRVTAFSVTETCPDTVKQRSDGVCPQTLVSLTMRNEAANTPNNLSIPYQIQRYNGNVWVAVVNGSTPALAAGASRTISSVVVPNLPTGTHRLRAVANMPANANLYEANTNNNVNPEARVTVPPLCNNNTNDDTEDTLVDENDPGCWTDPFDPDTYNPNDNSETGAIPAPRLSLTASPNVVRYGDPATIRYSIESLYDVSCTLKGPGMPTNPIGYRYTVGSDEVPVRTASVQSGPIYGTQTFQISCVPPSGTVDGVINPDDGEATVQVEVVPETQEI